MKKIKMLGFVLVCGLTLSACSDENAQSEASQSAPQSTEAKEVESTVVDETKEEEKQPNSKKDKFNEFAGLWENKNIDLQTIREKAWK